MNVFGVLKSVFVSLSRIFTLRLNLNGFSFSLGEMVVGLIIISFSIYLLRFLFTND